MDNKLLEPINRVLCETLRQHKDVAIRGLGSFSIVHKNQQYSQQKSGRVLLVPPGDEVQFIPAGELLRSDS